jgi:hypothetical protein
MAAKAMSIVSALKNVTYGNVAYHVQAMDNNEGRGRQC